MAETEYIIRIELHEKFKGEKIPQSDLDELHELMEDWGASQSISGSKGTYHLMSGMYRLEFDQDYGTDIVRDALVRHISSINRRKSILVIKSTSAAWTGLKIISPR